MNGKVKHRYLVAHPALEDLAREHAAKLEKAELDVTCEVVLHDDCQPDMMFILHYLPRVIQIDPGEVS